MIGISVCMIVKNEADFIQEAISSVAHLADEIVVLDTGSKDGTDILAKEKGAKVYYADWNEDFSDTRNLCHSYATQSIILVMDADERLIAGEKDEIHEIGEILRKTAGMAGRIKIINQISRDEHSTSLITRIFPNETNFTYKGKVHEQLYYNEDIVKALDVPLTFLHLGYSGELIQSKNKILRNTLILNKQLEELPNDPYILYQLGRTFYVAKEYSKAEYYLLQCKYEEDKSGKSDKKYYSTMMMTLGNTMLKLGKWDEIFDFLSLAIDKYPDYTDLYYIYGSALIEARDINLFTKIPEVFKLCLTLGEPDSTKYETLSGVGSYKASYNLGLFYELLGDNEKALYYYKSSAQDLFIPAQTKLVQF